MDKVLRLKWRARMFISSVRQLSDGGNSARAIGGKSGDRLTFRLPIKDLDLLQNFSKALSIINSATSQ